MKSKPHRPLAARRGAVADSTALKAASSSSHEAKVRECVYALRASLAYGARQRNDVIAELKSRSPMRFTESVVTAAAARLPVRESGVGLLAVWELP